MRAFIFAVLLLVGTYAAAVAQFNASLFQGSTSAGVTYAGPQDIVSSGSELFGWSLDAPSAAARGNNAVQVLRASDSTTQIFATGTNGKIDTTALATFLASTTGTYKIAYDNSGALRCSGACNAVQVSTNPLPTVTLSCLNGYPCFSQTGLSNQGMMTANAQSLTVTEPYSCYFLAERTGNFTSLQRVVASNQTGAGFSATSNDASVTSGTNQSFAASNSAWHDILVTTNGASSTQYVDGVLVASLNPGADAISNSKLAFGRAEGTGTQPVYGNFMFAYCWSGDQSSFAAALHTQTETNFGPY